ncbi:MAG: NAD-binding protein [Candidatus Marinimicrobia bacterium]|nr:NAD-binding protein [Candidatus Neomarinimicrobiota bacterium]
MIKKLSGLKDHFIVCGYGRMGKVICKELQNEKLLFVVIENVLEKFPILRIRVILL